MADDKKISLLKAAKEFNVGTGSLSSFLADKGLPLEGSGPNAKLSGEQYQALVRAFGNSTAAEERREAESIRIGTAREAEQQAQRPAAAPAPAPAPAPAAPERVEITRPTMGLKVIGTVELDRRGQVVRPPAPKAPVAAPAPEPAPVAKAPEAAPQAAAEVPAPAAKTAKKSSSKAVSVNGIEPLTTPATPAPAPEPYTEPAPAPSTPPPAPDPAPAPVPSAPEIVPQPAAPTEIPPIAPPPAPSFPSADEGRIAAQAPESGPGTPAGTDSPAAPGTPGGEGGLISAKADKLKGLTVVGTIQLPVDGRGRPGDRKRGDRKRIGPMSGPGASPGTGATGPRPGGGGPGYGGAPGPYRPGPGGPSQGGGGAGYGNRPGATPGQGARPYQGTNTGPGGRPQPGSPGGYAQNRPNYGGARPSAGRSKARKNRREEGRRRREGEANRLRGEETILRVTEFVSANDLASLMDVSVNEVISKAMQLGMFVSINQRLDAELITLLADEFGFEVVFTGAEEEAEIEISEDAPEDLETRAPIVTIMGHVDHGKTSLLDYIRKANVAEGEAGGITQHIGAYSVVTESGRRITFLDTPGHEAFTAMRARGAKVTDVVIIVIAADDSVMPQTREAINHAQAAGVPMVFAFNKIDKPGANAEKIREELAGMNILVEEWGGKFQTQEISAKKGLGINDLLEKVLLEADVLDLKANPDREASGTVIEASLDKGRGYLSTLLVQTGTLKVGDIVLAGQHFGRVRAMLDHRMERLKEAGPSMPVQILGLAGAPQAGDRFMVMETEREAREIATRREQLHREQAMRTRKHITLDEIGRRLAIGNFRRLNLVIKGDVDGSVEALSDSLLRLSTPEVEVNILHKGVGMITEGDVDLATTSDAIIIAFQVRPSPGARRLAEQEEIEIRQYSIIYEVIEEVKAAMEGLLAPKVEDVTIGEALIREVFPISKIGTIAGVYVTSGVARRQAQVRVIRAGIVIHTGRLASLKRFKDDVNEVKTGYECGLQIESYNQIQVDDTLEFFEQKEVKRTLAGAAAGN